MFSFSSLKFSKFLVGCRNLGTEYCFYVFSSTPLYQLNESWKTGFGRKFSPISVLLLGWPIISRNNRVHSWMAPHQPCEFYENRLKTATCAERFYTYMWCSVVKGPIWLFLETERVRKTREMIKKWKKKGFSYFGVLGHQKHSYVGRILKKSHQDFIHVQFYMTIKGPFGRFLLQLCTVSINRHKNKFPTVRRC